MSYRCRKETGALTGIPALLCFDFVNCRLELAKALFNLLSSREIIDIRKGSIL